jgi:hypothetical protein
MFVMAHFHQIHLETLQTTFLTLFSRMMMLDSKITSKAPPRGNVTYCDYFRLRNNIDFEVKNLCLEQKRKEIVKYNPFHYIFGYELKNQDWIKYGERQ